MKPPRGAINYGISCVSSINIAPPQQPTKKKSFNRNVYKSVKEEGGGMRRERGRRKGEGGGGMEGVGVLNEYLWVRKYLSFSSYFTRRKAGGKRYEWREKFARDGKHAGRKWKRQKGEINKYKRKVKKKIRRENAHARVLSNSSAHLDQGTQTWTQP